MSSLEELGPTLCAVARQSILRSLSEGLAPAVPGAASGLSFGVFVTLRTRGGELRGCVGSLRPTQDDVLAEAARAAVLAATRDPRFAPVSLSELDSLTIEVSVLMPEEPVADPSELDPLRYGVIVRDHEGRRGLLLPDIPGITEAKLQVAIARRKAGIREGTPCSLGRFAVRKFRERVGAAGIEPATSSV